VLRVSYIVNSVFSSRTYVLSREDCFDVWLVDCGDVERLPEDVRVAGVLLTHAHFDHIYGLNRLVERFPEVRAVVHETPGHHPSCLCFKVDGRLFTGDAYIPGCKVVTNLPEGDKVLAAASEQRIRAMVEKGGLVVCAGHEV